VPSPQSISLPPPRLSAVVVGNQLTIFWAATALNYKLELTTNLSAPTSWKEAPQIPVVSNAQATVTVPVGTTNTFFRLAAP